MKRLLLFMVILLTTSSFILAQNRIEGKVTDAKSGEALPGVTIYIKGTTIGTVSDVNGKYVLESAALKPQAVIVFSFVGYNTQEVVFQNQKVPDLKLEPSQVMLEELVVIGYGTTKKRNVLGAISKVGTQELTR